MSDTKPAISKNKKIVRIVVTVYMLIGFSLSVFHNATAYFIGKPTAFALTGSLKGNVTLAFWWFFLPMVMWPYELFWELYNLFLR